MKMTDILEKDKGSLLTALTGAPSAEKAVIVLENEIDRLLLRYNEQCSSEREREATAYMMQAVRLSLPLIDSNGKVKVWEHEDEEAASAKGGILSALLAVVGIALCVFGLIPMVMTWLSYSESTSQNTIITRAASVVAGLIMIFLSGYLMSKPSGKKRRQHQVEIHVDADKVYRNFRTAILSVDQSLEDVRSREKWEQREQAGNIDGRPATTPEIELFADLIAASYSNDPEYALEKIDDIKYFLHRQQIEVLDYSEATKQYFDLMPGVKAGTIRPALIADGTVLKKGLASTGK